MSSGEQTQSNEPISLSAAKVLVVDPQASGRSQLGDTLRLIGFRDIEACASFDLFTEKVGSAKPDLVFLDIDAERELACTMIRKIRNSELGEIPFVVVVALTAKPELEAVQGALEAGSDDMVVKPVTVEALRQRVTNQIENRKEFIATDDYVGPDRRREQRELTEEDLASIEVPNTLRHTATGDESAALTEERVQETLRSLSTQKFYHLSKKVSRIAEHQKKNLKGNAESVDCAKAIEEISKALTEIDEIIGEQNFRGVEQVVASTRRALNDIKASKGEVTKRHFELLQAHGGSVTVVLQESEETAGALVTQLEKAVSVVRGGSEDKNQREEAEKPKEPKGNGVSPQEQAPKAPPKQPAKKPAAKGKHSLSTRLKAWWEGEDPQQFASKGRK
ncbi:MAG: response regulator [Kiloniellales bacterium]